MEALIKYTEPKYEVSNYIYEFCNTISNLSFIILAYYVKEPNNYVLYLMGIGSMMFHGTPSNFLCELFDEIPMIFGLNILLFKLIKYNYFFILIDYCLIGIYIYFKLYNIFLVYFISKILVILYNLPNNKFKFYAVITLISSSMCWEIEQYTYRKRLYRKKEYKYYYLFHSLWHILSALSFYFAFKCIKNKIN